jgi:nucleotide-binding universal stress UspA family protein
MYEHILLPLDGSDQAERAIPHAIALATGCGGKKISIVHVIDHRKYQQLALAGKPPATYLNRVAAGLRSRGVEKTDVKALTGDPARAIVEYGEANACDIIVMTSRVRRGMARWLGGVANKVAQKSSVPVLLVVS